MRMNEELREKSTKDQRGRGSNDRIRGWLRIGGPEHRTLNTEHPD